MDIHARLKHFYSQPEFYANTLRIVIQGGKPAIKSPMREEPFETLTQARDWITARGVTEFHEYGPDTPYSSRMLQHIAKQEPNLRITQEVYKIEGPAQAQLFERQRIRDDVHYGLWGADDERVRWLRFYKDGKELAEEEVRRVFGKHGLDFPGGVGKSAKRLKALTAQKAIESIGDPMTVSVVSDIAGKDLLEFQRREAFRLDDDAHFKSIRRTMMQDDEWEAAWRSKVEPHIVKDAQGNITRIRPQAKQQAMLLRAEQAARMSQDGAVQMSRRALEGVLEDQKAQLNQIEGRLNTATDRGTRLKLSQDKRKIQKAIDDIDQTLRTGSGNFNTRMLNFDLLLKDQPQEVQDHIADLVARGEGLQIKGNVVLRESLPGGADAQIFWRNISTGGGGLFDKVSQTTDEGVRYLARARESGYLTLTPQHVRPYDPARLDIQTATAHPELYDFDTLKAAQEDYLTRIRQMMGGLETGETPEPIKEMFRSLLDRTADTDPVTHYKTRKVLDALEGGMSIADDPVFARRVVDILKMAVGRGGKDDLFRMPNMMMPGTYRAHVMPANVVGQNVMSGSIRYDKRYGWLMNANDASEVYASFGGFDFDDALNGMIRYDADGNLKVVMTRSPTARGEIALFNLDHSQGLVDYSFRRAAGSNQEVARYHDELLRKYKEIKQLKEELADLNFTEHAAGDTRANLNKKRTQIQNRLNRVRKDVGDIRQILVKLTFRPMTDDLSTIPVGGRTASAPGMPARTGSQRIFVGDKFYYRGEEQIRQLFEGGLLYDTGESVGVADDVSKKVTQRLKALGVEEGQEAYEAMSKRIEDLLFFQNYVSEGKSKALGTYTNARMFMDHFIASNKEELLRANLKLASVQLFDTETFIDAYIQSVKGLDVDPNKLAEDIYRSMIRGAIEGQARGLDVGIDPRLTKIKLMGDPKRIFEEERAKLLSDNVAGVDQVSYDKIFFQETDRRATISLLTQTHARGVSEVEAAGARVTSMPRDIMERQFGERASRDAETLIRSWRRSMAESMRQPLLSYDLIGEMDTDELNVLRSIEASEEANTAVLRALSGMAETVEGEQVLGSRAMAAMARMGQLLEGEAGDLREMGGISETGLMDSMTRWVRGKETPPISLRELYKRTGQVLTADKEVEAFLRQIVGSDEFNIIRRLQAGIDVEDGIVSLTGMSPDVEKAFRSSLAPSLDEAMYGPLDTRSIVNVGDEQVPLGRMLLELMSGELTDQTHASYENAIRTAYGNFISAAGQGAIDPASGMTEGLRAAYASAAEDFGLDKAAAARRAVDQANNVASGGGLGSLRKLMDTRLGKAGLYAGIATVGAGLVHQVRGKDHTPEDMQGPPNMPGGNPYQGRQPPLDLSARAPRQMRSPGVTYEVRTRGSDPSNLYEEMADIIGGGSVTGTTYDIAEVRSGFTPAGFEELR